MSFNHYLDFTFLKSQEMTEVNPNTVRMLMACKKIMNFCFLMKKTGKRKRELWFWSDTHEIWGWHGNVKIMDTQMTYQKYQNFRL